MGMRATCQKTVSFGGKSFTESFNIDSDTGLVIEVSLAAGKAGTLTTRTDADTGVITTSAAHGLSAGNRVDVYWSGGRRRGMLVSSAADGTHVTVGTAGGDVGAGDNFPIATTAVVICLCTEITAAFAGNDANIIVICADHATALVVAADASSAELSYWHITGTDFMASWDNAHTDNTNPNAGDAVAKFYVSNGNSSAANVIKIGVGLDA